MTQATAQREMELVRGTIESVITKGADKWQVAVVPEGSQYAKNLWSKDAALVADMQQRVGQGYDFVCSVSHWTRQDGQPVRSLWLESVAQYNSVQGMPQATQQAAQPQAQLPQAAPQPSYAPSAPQQQQYSPPPSLPTPSPQQSAAVMTVQPSLAPQRLPDEVKEMRIMRQTASKVATMFLPYLPEPQRTLAGLEEVCEYLVRYYTGGPQHGRQQQPQQPTNGPAQTYNPVTAESHPEPGAGEYDASDIPF